MALTHAFTAMSATDSDSGPTLGYTFANAVDHESWRERFDQEQKAWDAAAHARNEFRDRLTQALG